MISFVITLIGVVSTLIALVLQLLVGWGEIVRRLASISNWARSCFAGEVVSQRVDNPVVLLWEEQHHLDRGVLSRDLIIRYEGPPEGDVQPSVPKAWLWIEATQPGMRMGGSDMPRAKIEGVAHAWNPRPVHRWREERGNVKFDLSSGTAAQLVSFHARKATLYATVEYRDGPGGKSGSVEADPVELSV